MASQETVEYTDNDDLIPVTGYATKEELELIDEATGRRQSRSSFLIESATKRAKEVIQDENKTSH